MVFSSIQFLGFFFPVVFLLYYIMPGRKAKNIILIISSIVFYAFGEPVYVFLMLGSILVNYILGIILGRECKFRKIICSLAVLLNLSVLILFKYSGLGLALPIGISFYTFQAISYIVDVYRNPEISQKKLINVVLYISFFPQLIAGPIIKYHDIDKQIETRKESVEQVYGGIKRFVYGMAKKVLLANSMAVVVDRIFSTEPANVNMAAAWLAAICYMLQIYFDFSGYSDMAIGLGSVFGFTFKENFNYPYAARNIKDFWRRWHISLSTWFKEYLYIPLGGNRKGKKRTYINKFIVFFVTGLWHGANLTFVLWGLWHGLFSVLEEIGVFKRNVSDRKIIGRVYTFLVVMLGFVMFRADSVKAGTVMIGRMFYIGGFTQYSMGILVSCLTPLFLICFILSIVLMFPVYPWLKQKAGSIAEPIEAVLIIILMLLSMMYIASGSYNPFIYFRF